MDVTALLDPAAFSRLSGIWLRPYQAAVARAVAESVLYRRGLTFVVMFPRQSGKNETQAQLEAFLLFVLSKQPAEMVKLSPTWKPQSLNAMRRLERALCSSPLAYNRWQKESGYIYRLGQARMTFLSGSPEANIVGATASTLLEVDEAQDITLAKYDKEIAPMAASTNATRVFWGTAWTSQTLLARELRAVRDHPAVGRAFILSADEVAREVPAYGAFVAGQVARLGRSHPMVRTQYFSEEIDGQVGLFPPERIALMRGDHAGRVDPQPGKRYALLVDVGGEAFGQAAPAGVTADGSAIATEIAPATSATDPGAATGAGYAQEKRDATALTIVEIDRATLADPGQRAPVYRVMGRRVWTGARHTQVYAEILALAQHWHARQVVVDATGIGAGLASFLEKALPGRGIPFIFSQASKSRLGWRFLSMVDAGRWQECGGAADVLDGQFLNQLAHIQYEIVPGPGKTLKWSVPDGARDPLTGGWLHDDLVMSAALSAVLDELDWSSPGAEGPGIIRAVDPLEEMQGF